MKEIFKFFILFGCYAFGGPAAHIALMHKELVDNKKWIDEERYLSLISLTNLIPGPNSTEMVMHMGYHKGKTAGMIVAGLSFILPACLLTVLFAIFFEKLSSFAFLMGLMAGFRASVIAIIFGATQKLYKKAVKDKSDLIVMITSVILVLAGLGPIEVLLILLAAGIFKAAFMAPVLVFITNIEGLLASSQTIAKPENFSIFLAFGKIGSILFGSGYVLVAFLEQLLVNDLAWLSKEQLLDAITVGQFTPGPVLTASTYVGYQLGGLPGSVAATVGMFLPAFIFVILLNIFITKFLESEKVKPVLKILNAGSLGLILATAINLTIESFGSHSTLAILAISSFVHFKFKKLQGVYIILGGGLLGLVFELIKF